jgi:hypothetical protein
MLTDNADILCVCVQFLVEIYQHRPPVHQLELASDATTQTHARNAALLTLVPTLIVCPLFPLAIIALWNVFMTRRVRRRQDVLDSTSVSSNANVSCGKAAEIQGQVVVSVDGNAAAVRCVPVSR